MVRTFMRKNGFKKIYCLYLVVSFVPINISKMMVDIFINIKKICIESSIRYFTLRELSKFDIPSK